MAEPVLDHDEMANLIDSIDEQHWGYGQFFITRYPLNSEDLHVPRSLALPPQKPDQRSVAARCFEVAWPGAAALIQAGGGPS